MVNDCVHSRKWSTYFNPPSPEEEEKDLCKHFQKPRSPRIPTPGGIVSSFININIVFSVCLSCLKEYQDFDNKKIELQSYLA